MLKREVGWLQLEEKKLWLEVDWDLLEGEVGWKVVWREELGWCRGNCGEQGAAGVWPIPKRET